MNWEVLSSVSDKQKINIDPRTKIIILILICTLVVGGENSGIMLFIKPALTIIVLFLLTSIGKWRTVFICTLLYGICFIGENFMIPLTNGLTAYLLLFTCGLVARLLPGMLMGYYTVQSTTVSEFIAAMERIHLSQKLIIPLAVMFRFFPTVIEEYLSISDAMRMRGIRMGGKKAGKMLEYRLVPMMVCVVKIGEELSAASLTRGLGAPVKRTNICKIGFNIADVILIVVCAIISGFSLARKMGG
jgi:energy-coupling factor transporter transmembrane protein EcfT